MKQSPMTIELVQMLNFSLLEKVCCWGYSESCTHNGFWSHYRTDTADTPHPRSIVISCYLIPSNDNRKVLWVFIKNSCLEGAQL